MTDELEELYGEIESVFDSFDLCDASHIEGEDAAYNAELLVRIKQKFDELSTKVRSQEFGGIEQEIIECLKNKTGRGFAYLESRGEEVALKGNFSDHNALRFVKMLITERPMIHHKLKGWKPKPTTLANN